jgi:hypothetical protein
MTEQARKQKFEGMVREIRRMRAVGAAYEVDAMLLTLVLEKRPSYWRDTPATTFPDIIRDRRLGTVKQWRAFKAAHKVIPHKHLRMLGVPAVCLIAVQPKRLQPRLVQLALNFRKRHEIGPTYQYVTMLLPKRNQPAKPTRAALVRYIEDLKGVIERLGGTVPPMENS